MAISQELNNFYNNWLKKANSYTGNTLNDYYNKAYTLFTLYNRLYSEATFTLAKEGRIKFKEHQTFPDKKGATKYSPQFIGYNHLLDELQSDKLCSDSINLLIKTLKEKRFHVKLSRLYAEPQPEKDEKLLSQLESTNTEIKISAIMDYIYSVRCNMVHGNKGFEPVQVEILSPVIIILNKVIKVLYNKFTA